MKRFKQISLLQFVDHSRVKKTKGVQFVDSESFKITKMAEDSSFVNKEYNVESEESDATIKEFHHHFLKIEDCCSSLSALKPSPNHTILFDVNVEDIPNVSYPATYTDKWEKHFVRLPCSSRNLYPVEENGNVVIKSRWELIEKSLLSDIKNSKDLERAILSYNSQYENQWNMSGLHDFFENVLSKEKTLEFFTHLLPAMILLALQLPVLCTQPIPLLERRKNHKITLSQMQVGCLLANAFFCTFPRRNTKHRKHTDPEYIWYPDINFNRLFIGTRKGIESKRAEKLKCILNYFQRITSEKPEGVITFHRIYHQESPEWSQSKEILRSMLVSSEGFIEKEGYGLLQVDFANKFVGGGVLGLGLVQEEIRFVLCPELILSRLFTERLDATEALLITGCEQFNKCTGYGNTFKWAGDFKDNTPHDNWKRKCTKVVAIDALSFQTEEDQYKIDRIKRELNKAYTGFSESEFDTLPAIATGNWGCGVFRGNPCLKSLIQFMAASQAGRDMIYFTFGNRELQQDISQMYTFLKEKCNTVGDLWKLLEAYSTAYTLKNDDDTPELYEFIYRTLNR
ncbi:poly(ADP-ribose) glycohydrolase-like isoform X1 [Centruroides vittatus]|uniref:poly(ADP-ribose) glycohydrolase-like isoform X1 n=2 Tax=Centruroides vittatus TaxID=120091 RepID=UPI003510B950